MAFRSCNLLCVTVGLLTALSGGAPTMAADWTARQVVIRAPGARLVAEALEHPGDAALVRKLWNWVQEGAAEVVSDLSASAPRGARANARSGRVFEWVTENHQEFGSDTGEAFLIPLATEKVFIGSSLEVGASWPEEHPENPYANIWWQASFSPCDEKTVPWPCWWPEAKRPPKVSWYQQKDFFKEEILTDASPSPDHGAILGIMRRPDDLDPSLKRPDTLDVFLAQIDPGRKPARPADESAPHRVPRRCTILGFGVSDLAAAKLLADGATAHGKSLLDGLLSKLATGDARLRLFVSLSASGGSRYTLNSSREHAFPSEMPTIPSAWDVRPVGTRLEIDSNCTGSYNFMQINLEHHPALPRRAEWRCALETPDLFMWQPQFFVRQVRTGFDFDDERVALLGAMRTPECQQDAKGIVPGETLVLVAKLDGTTAMPEENAARAPRLELEAFVFDIPASEAAAWDAGLGGLVDDSRFNVLMQRAEGKEVKIAAHVALSTAPDLTAEIGSVEEVLTVTEVDPPREASPTRYRPTAMEQLPTGTAWKVTAHLAAPADPLLALGPLEIQVQHTLSHDAAPPREPSYKEIITESSASPVGNIPRAIVFKEQWDGAATLVPGKARCIGVRKPPGNALEGRLHVGFLRARVTAGKEASGSLTEPADPFAPHFQVK